MLLSPLLFRPLPSAIPVQLFNLILGSIGKILGKNSRIFEFD